MPAYELTVVIPTVNERDNIEPLLARLDQCLAGVAWEAIVVDDDSTDGTADLVRDIARRRGNVRVLQRIGRRGLSSACTEGMMASHAPFLAVMDADLQHDETVLPAMLEVLRSRPVDLVVGSRHVAGGGLGAFSAGRRWLSALGGLLGRLVLRVDLKDPMSGFFMVRSDFFHQTVRRMSNKGFKILLDLVVSAPRAVRFVELPYQFGSRLAGASKLDSMVSLEYLHLIADKLFGHIVPVRFVIFVLVGSLGLLLHLGVLGGLYLGAGLSFYAAQVAATLTAMTANFFLDNAITYRDRRLHGWDLARGLASFYLACAIGALANFQVAQLVFDHGLPWMLAGLIGAMVGSVWNFGVTSTFTWRRSPA